MQVLVTRPAREAQQWVQGLRLRGLAALALPLIEIVPARDPQPVHRAWSRLADYQALMFVSGNAVDCFFMANQAAARADIVGATIKFRAWATGPGTREALRQAGVEAARIDSPPDDAGQFDSEALWQVVRAQARPGSRMLIVRGSDAAGRLAGRDWLQQQLHAAGAAVDEVVAYERKLPEWQAAQRELAINASAGPSVWLFSSSEAIANLGQLLPGQSWQAARAVATHPRIAQAAREAGFGVVCESRPALPDVVASIESTA